MRASLAAAVVLPDPCRPASTTPVGLRGESARSRAAPPISSVSSSETILTTCWPGSTRLSTSSPSALDRTSLVNWRTTLKFTSASRSARRISRIAALTSSSVSAPRWRTSPRVAWSFSERASNTGTQLRAQASGIRHRHQASGRRRRRPSGSRLFRCSCLAFRRLRRCPRLLERLLGRAVLRGRADRWCRQVRSRAVAARAEALGQPAQSLGELGRDDEDLVRLALGELGQHLQVLVGEELAVGLARVDG